jgi:ribonuclease P protein component
MPNTDKKCQMAFVAGKKVGGAVVRNRCKRLIREAVRLNQDTISNDYNYMFVAKSELGHRGLKEIEKELRFLFKKNGLWV